MADIRSIKIPDWITEAADTQQTLPLVFDTNNAPSKREPIPDDAVYAFVEDIVAVCVKHGLWIVGNYTDLVITRDPSDQLIRGAILDD